MSTYRVEWPCCGSATETEAWEPEQCPFCHPDCGTEQSELSRLREALEKTKADQAEMLALVREMREALDHATRFRSDGLGFVAGQLIAKADAILKESGEPVKYGCHADANSVVSGVFDGVFLDCIEEDCSQVKDGKCSGSHDCQHWRPIK